MSTVADGLQRIGYSGPLMERDYSFPDWFSRQELRTLDIAVFGQTPVSYESACIGVTHVNGLCERPLVDSFRAFGAPILLEIDQNEIREWEVSSRDKHNLVGRYPTLQLAAALANRASHWQPKTLLRAKNIGVDPYSPIQRNLFSGLIPELESEIQETLDPLLRTAVSETRTTYRHSTGRDPDPRSLFKVVFLALTAKVFSDRRVIKFVGNGDFDSILTAAAKHDGQSARILLNKDAREAAVRSVWADLDFRNLSVEVLADIWSRTLVDADTKRELGIHRTPRSVVRYIVKHVMSSISTGDDDRIVYEPCSGSATFLIGALNYIRNSLPLSSAESRHKYFVKTLHGFEKDPFAVELSGLALTLADFPHRNDWNIEERDVFTPGAMTDSLRRSSAVLCNPPFGKFTQTERDKYGHVHPRKPAELIRRVLADLHPSAVMGFVLPYIFVDGVEFRDTRQLLAERFASIEVTVLPEKSFSGAPTDIALLVAKEPILHESVRFVFRKVNDSAEAWRAFQEDETVSTTRNGILPRDAARAAFSLAELDAVWLRLAGGPVLADIANIHRGIEWKSMASSPRHLRTTPADGYVQGVAPRTDFSIFEVPPLMYLDVRPDDQRSLSYQRPWSLPKVILRKSRVSRGKWRLAAFPDSSGITCYQTYYGVWPSDKSGVIDEVVLAAILNGPVANAFIADHEGTRDITAAVLRTMPMPMLSADQADRVRKLVRRYQSASTPAWMESGEDPDPERLLKQIDAIVLQGYRLTPRLEREVLDHFNGSQRKVAHPFSNYFSEEFDLFVSLSQYLNPDFQGATVANFLKQSAGR